MADATMHCELCPEDRQEGADDQTTWRSIVHQLRAAGWKHTRQWPGDADGRDTDSAPWDNGFWVHSWRRGDGDLTAHVGCDSGKVEGWLRYRPDGDEYSPTAYIHVDIAAEIGAGRVLALARSLGLLERHDRPVAWTP